MDRGHDVIPDIAGRFRLRRRASWRPNSGRITPLCSRGIVSCGPRRPPPDSVRRRCIGPSNGWAGSGGKALVAALRDDALHHDRKDVLAADQPAIEERRSWCHQHDEAGADQHESSVPGIDTRHDPLPSRIVNNQPPCRGWIWREPSCGRVDKQIDTRRRTLRAAATGPLQRQQCAIDLCSTSESDIRRETRKRLAHVTTERLIVHLPCIRLTPVSRSLCAAVQRIPTRE